MATYIRNREKYGGKAAQVSFAGLVSVTQPESDEEQAKNRFRTIQAKDVLLLFF